MSPLKCAFSWLAVILTPTAVLIVMLVGRVIWGHYVETPRYAGKYFDKRFVVEDILESRRWHWGEHPWAHEALGCTYAIATLPETRSTHPPSTWEGAWEETPVNMTDGRPDNVQACAYLWPHALVTRLQNAYDQKGSFHVSSRDTVLLYSPTENIAARIHFGD